MIKNLPIICLTFFKFYLGAQSFVATYGFVDVSNATGTVDPSATPSVIGLSCHSFSAIGTSANPSASGRFSFTNWPLGGVNGTDDYSNFTGALSPTVYYEVSIAVNSGYTLSLNTISFSMRRSSTGIRNFCVRSSLDGYTNNLAASTGTAVKLSIIPDNVFFWSYDSVSTSSDQKGSILALGNLYSSLTQSLSFRFFAWNAESSGGSFSIDNVSFAGSVLDSATAANPLGNSFNASSSKNIKFYPNPCINGELLLENAEEIQTLEILSVTGKSLAIYPQGKEEEITKINLDFLQNGIYFVKTFSPKGFSLHKIILTR